MSVLERLYSLEIEFHRLFRSHSISDVEAASIHTSYALQRGYEPLLRTVGTVDSISLSNARERLAGVCDPRDADAAFRSLRQLFVIR